jgi:hypothetical protein
MQCSRAALSASNSTLAVASGISDAFFTICTSTMSALDSLANGTAKSRAYWATTVKSVAIKIGLDRFSMKLIFALALKQ